MGKIIVTFNDIIELNHQLEDLKLSFKVHLHDACGNQSFTVEPLSNCACEGKEEEMQKIVVEYFKKKRINIRFLDNQLDFVILVK